VTVRLRQPASTATSAISVTYGSPVAKGSLLVFFMLGSTQAVTSVTDTLGNAWSFITSQSTFDLMFAYWAISAADGPCTVTANGAGVGGDTFAYEVACGSASGTVVRPFAVLDSFTQGSGSSALVNPGPITPRYKDSFLVSATVELFSGSLSAAAENGWVLTVPSTFYGAQTLIPVSSQITSHQGYFYARR